MFKPTLHSHTHCQAAPANAQTQAWQRACLPQRTDRMTMQQKLKKNNFKK